MSQKVSIIVPTYQRALELDNLLFPSLVKQGVLPAEIVVVDDTEGNAVMDVCGKWAGRFGEVGVPLHFMRNAPPRSAARSRNEGASSSTCDTLLFLDSDLELSPDYLERLLSALRLHADAVGIQGLITNWGDEPRAKRFMEHYGRPGTLSHRVAGALTRNLLGGVVPSKNSCRLFEYPVVLDRLIECEWLSGSNLCLRRAAYEATRFEADLEGYSLGDDVLLSRKLMALGKLYITPDAKCTHHWSLSGAPERTKLGGMERFYLHRLYGLKGDIIYFNRRLAFKVLGYSEGNE
jgi:GT2 family glycosyltransferase